MMVSRRFSTGLHNARNFSPGNLVWKGRTEKIEMMALPFNLPFFHIFFAPDPGKNPLCRSRGAFRDMTKRITCIRRNGFFCCGTAKKTG
ncbi:hypothetical protein B4135_1123 [Caldibacillus debilis]|uniref:Uncharacterized protein n=1 Tax=Caldibacillus debilis TaxID=301148 RepID=A0A150MDK4_9BACI|nr:hypothetical protein B4135_1123 [Caldibacillus debilis]